MFKALVIISFGLTFAILAGYLTWQRIEAAESLVDTRRYLVYATDADDLIARPGTILSSGDIDDQFVPVPARTGFDSPLIEANAENRRFVTLRPINDDIARGRFLTFDLFEDLSVRRLSEVVSPGMRGMTIPVNSASSMSNELRPGDRIDLMSVPSGVAVGAAEVILADVKVLGVGEYFSLDDYIAAREPSFSTITIEVTPDEGPMLAARREEQSGGFSVMLRNACDTAVAAVGCN